MQNQWSPIYDIAAILTSIQSLLSDPNPTSPANSEASTLFESDRREYHRRVRMIVEESWLDDEGELQDEDKKVAAGSGEGESSIPASRGDPDTIFAAAQNSMTS